MLYKIDPKLKGHPPELERLFAQLSREIPSLDLKAPSVFLSFLPA
jgi:hypothetical protein